MRLDRPISVRSEAAAIFHRPPAHVNARARGGAGAPVLLESQHYMSSARTFLSSSIGKKIVMAVTGLALFGFVVGHLAGNLQVYLGREAMNHYAEFLREALHGTGLWIARGGMLLAVALHIWAATSLTLMNRAARPQGYRRRADLAATYASRTMRWSGVLVALFVVYHLMHLTWGNVHPDFRHGDVYHNFIAGFRQPLVSLFYVVAMLALGLHMQHGVWSMLQTVGLNHPRYNRLRQAFAYAISAVVVLGNISFPVAVLTGLLHE
jgi:succinate dehydrogenase / fumarate reductase cytochrome b subunit